MQSQHKNRLRMVSSFEFINEETKSEMNRPATSRNKLQQLNERNSIKTTGMLIQ